MTPVSSNVRETWIKGRRVHFNICPPFYEGKQRLLFPFAFLDDHGFKMGSTLKDKDFLLREGGSKSFL